MREQLRDKLTALLTANRSARWGGLPAIPLTLGVLANALSGTRNGKGR